MYGLPTEQEEDLQETVAMVARVRKWMIASQRGRGRVGRLAVSANPFVPKPHTPLGREPMASLQSIRKARILLSRGVRRLGGVTFSGFSPRRAVLQCLLDRGGVELADLLEAAGGRWPPPGKLLADLVPNFNEIVFRPLSREQSDGGVRVDVGTDPATVRRERDRAMNGEVTPQCTPELCGVCGSCSGLVAGLPATAIRG
jgi:hypothetical protein